MKLRHIKRFYNRLSNDTKGIKWRHLTDTELNKSMREPQIVANCYDEATRYSLLASKKGREMLRKRIWIDKSNPKRPAYKILLNIEGKNEAFRATFKDYWGKFSLITQRYWLDNFNHYMRLSLGVNIAIEKMIKKYPKMKPFYSRLYFASNACEYNKPSNAFKWFTGKNPMIIGESDFNLSLKPYQSQVKALFNRLRGRNEQDFSLVAMSGLFPARVNKGLNPKHTDKILGWHCLSIVRICKNGNIHLKEPRSKGIIRMTTEEFIKKFKGIIGFEY